MLSQKKGWRYASDLKILKKKDTRERWISQIDFWTSSPGVYWESGKIDRGGARGRQTYRYYWLVMGERWYSPSIGIQWYPPAMQWYLPAIQCNDTHLVLSVVGQWSHQSPTSHIYNDTHLQCNAIQWYTHLVLLGVISLVRDVVIWWYGHNFFYKCYRYKSNM